MESFLNDLKNYSYHSPYKAIFLMLGCCAASFSAQVCRVGYIYQQMPAAFKFEKGMASLIFLAIAAYIMNSLMDIIETKTNKS